MLTNHFVKCAVHELSEIIDAPEKDLAIWVQQNAKKFLEIQKFYPEDEDCPEEFLVLDAEDQQLLYDVIGLYFMNVPWPRAETCPRIMEQFENKLNEVLSRYDWKLKGETYYATSTQVELRQGAA